MKINKKYNLTAEQIKWSDWEETTLEKATDWILFFVVLIAMCSPMIIYFILQ